jgi:hypothetical protein
MKKIDKKRRDVIKKAYTVPILMVLTERLNACWWGGGGCNPPS